MSTIIFYPTESGKSPVKEFLDSLEAKQARKVVWVLQLVEELERVPTQYFRLNPDFPKEFGSLCVAPCGGLEILFVAPDPRADARG
jgi:hypothetical protein